jgi:hypothetical protein
MFLLTGRLPEPDSATSSNAANHRRQKVERRRSGAFYRYILLFDY